MALLARVVNLVLMFAISFFLIRYSWVQSDVKARDAIANFLFISAFFPLMMLGLNKTVFTLIRFDNEERIKYIESAYFTLEFFAISIVAIFIHLVYQISWGEQVILWSFGMVSITSLRRDLYYVKQRHLDFELIDLITKVLVMLMAITMSVISVQNFAPFIGIIAVIFSLCLHVRIFSIKNLLKLCREIFNNRRVGNYTLAFIFFLVIETIYYNLPGYYIAETLGSTELNNFNFWMRSFLIIVTGSRVLSEYRISKNIPEDRKIFLKKIICPALLLNLICFGFFVYFSPYIIEFLNAPIMTSKIEFFLSLLGWSIINAFLHPIGIYLTYHPDGKIIALRGSMISASIMAGLFIIPAFVAESAFHVMGLALCAYAFNLFYSGLKLTKLMKNAKPKVF